MANYQIQMMNIQDWMNYMSGSDDYNVIKVVIQADTAEIALAMAKSQFPMLKINEGYIVDMDKAKADAEKAKAKAEEAKAKREAAKQRKIERDLANGITPEMRKAMTYARRYEKEIDELKAKLAELEAKKSYWDKIAKGT